MGIDKIVSPSKRLVTLRTTDEKNSNAIVEEGLKNGNHNNTAVMKPEPTPTSNTLLPDLIPNSPTIVIASFSVIT